MTKSLLLAAAAALAFCGPALAGPTSLTTQVFKETPVTAANGAVSTVLKPAGKIVPGQQVVYVLTYHNGEARPADGVVINNPLPAGLTYGGAVDGAAPQVSVDGQTFGDLAQLTVAKGGAAPAPASMNDVTALRWRLATAVPANGDVKLSFRARLK